METKLVLDRTQAILRTEPAVLEKVLWETSSFKKSLVQVLASFGVFFSEVLSSSEGLEKLPAVLRKLQRKVTRS